jgi:hypothetical protein
MKEYFYQIISNGIHAVVNKTITNLALALNIDEYFAKALI